MSGRKKVLLLVGTVAVLVAAGIFGLRACRDALPGNRHTTLNETYGLSVRGIDNKQLNALLKEQTTAEQVREESGITRWLERRPKEYAPGGTAGDVTGLSAKALARKQKDLLNYCAAELYGYAADLLEQMGQMRAAALQEWKSREKAQRTTEHKILFGFEWLEKVYAVEVEADRTVQSFLKRYRGILEQWGADTGPMDGYWDYYCEIKTGLKTFFLNKYLG